MRLSALGLEAVGVQSGPVKIKHAATATDNMSTSTTIAAAMTSLYWNGVCDILEKDETDVATFLLVCPPTTFKVSERSD